MGLDVTAYEKATLIDDHRCADPDDCYEAGHRQAYIVAPEMVKSLRDLAPGWYDVSGGDRFDFPAGSYTGYGAFRDLLSVLTHGCDGHRVYVDQEAHRDGPFFELIAFADNEGTIGPAAAADLAKDFEDWAERVLPDLDEWDRQRYLNWSKAFHLAAGSGLVDFH